jgi:hypothetical protein
MDTETIAVLAASALAIVTQLGTVYTARKNAQTSVATKQMELDGARQQQDQLQQESRLKEQIERREAHRREQIKRLDRLMEDLRAKRGELQFWQNKGDGSFAGGTEKSEILYGDAYSIMLSVGDAEVTEAAEEAINPHTPFPDKVKAISQGLKRMAQIVNDLHKEQVD